VESFAEFFQRIGGIQLPRGLQIGITAVNGGHLDVLPVA
jgi:hypothetical protein